MVVFIDHEQRSSMAGWVAEIGAEAGFLPRYLASGGAAVGVWAGGEGEIPHDDAHAGEIRWLSSGFLLLDVQSLPPFVGSSADGGRRVFGSGAFDAIDGDLQRGVRRWGGEGIGRCEVGDSGT